MNTLILIAALSAPGDYTAMIAAHVAVATPTEIKPLTFAPATVKVSPQCECHLEGGCKCVDCKCAAAHKKSPSSNQAEVLAVADKVGFEPTTSGVERSALELHRPLRGQRAGSNRNLLPQTSVAQTGQWVRSCNGSSCKMVWQPSQQAAATKPNQNLKPQRGGWYLGKNLGRQK